MKKYQLIVILFTWLCGWNTGNAADVSAGTYVIEALRVSQPSGLLYVKTDRDIIVKNSTCTRFDMFAINKDAQMFNELYSSLLSASLASKVIQVWVSTDANDCLNNRQKITVVEIDF